MLKKIFVILSLCALVSACDKNILPTQSPQISIHQLQFEKPMFLCETRVKAPTKSHYTDPLYVLGIEGDPHPSNIQAMQLPTFQEYFADPTKWQTWKSSEANFSVLDNFFSGPTEERRIVGVIATGTKYHLYKMGTQWLNDTSNAREIMLDSGPYKDKIVKDAYWHMYLR